MRVESVELYRYAFPLLVRPSLRGGQNPMREGLLLRIVSDGGHSGWGEVAPLPGFSDESLSEAQPLVVAEALNLVGLTVPATFDELSRMPGTGSTPGTGRNRISSVAFGIELGLASLSAEIRGVSLAEWVAPSARGSVPVNALLTGSAEELPEMARARMGSGYETFKLKVGRGTVDEDLDLVRRVRGAIGPRLILRLDANRAWEYDEACRFSRSVLPFNPVFVEEPLKDPDQLKSLCVETSIRIALDETVAEMAGASVESGASVEDWTFAAAAILKPTLVGGFVASHSWSERFAKAGVEPVLSSSFDTEIGMRGLVALAAAASGSGWAAGLDTLRYMGGSVLTHSFWTESAVLAVDEITKPPEVNMEALTRVL